MATLKLITTEVTSWRNRHYAMRAAWIRDIVKEEDNPRLHRLLRRFQELSGLPVLLNTSFNRAGEPIVCSPSDAVRCFIKSGLDALVMGDYIVYPANGCVGVES